MKYKITLVGNFRAPFTSESQYLATLRDMGYEVFPLQEQEATSRDILEKGLGSDLVVFVHTHGWQTPGQNLSIIFKKLKKRGIPVITYHLDLWFGLERQKDLQDDFYKELSYFFTVDKLMADWFNKETNVKGVFLPAGVFEEEVQIMQPQRVRYDIVFTGSGDYHEEFPYRSQLIQFLKSTYGNKFIHIGNKGQVSPRHGLELNQIYRNAKITVGDTLNKDFNYPYYSSDRLFEQTGRGAFTIYPWIKGIDDWFIDGEEIVTYEHGNLDDLKLKIDYYLNNSEERERIRIAGFKRAQNEHTYRHRWLTILNEVFKNDREN